MAELDLKLLISAKEHKLADVIDMLKLGADANYQHTVVTNIWGSTEYDCPLHHAVLHRNINMVEYLLQHGAKGTTIFGYKLWNGTDDRRSISKMIFHDDYISENFLEICELFIRYGAFDPNEKIIKSISTRRSSGMKIDYPLHLAIKSLSIKKIDMLLKFGANPNENSSYHCDNEMNGHTSNTLSPLVFLLSVFQSYLKPKISFNGDENSRFNTKRLEIMTNLLKYKADPNQISIRTIHQPNSKYVDDPSICYDYDDPRRYIKKYISIEVKESPLYLAVLSNNIDFVYILLLYGADPSITTYMGKNIVKIARKIKVSKEINTLLISPPSFIKIREILNNDDDINLIRDVTQTIVEFLC